MTTRIRQATVEDLKEWVRLRCLLWPEKTSVHREELRRLFLPGSSSAHPRRHHGLLATVEGSERSVGFAELSVRNYAEGCFTEHIGYLEGIYVDPSYRRRGVGRSLVTAGEQWAKALGCKEFASDTELANDPSARFHRRIGFDEVERVVCFRKQL